jgi:nicotinate-nucleotide adenylyltransferase
VAIPRPGYCMPDIENLEKKIPDITRQIILLDTPQIEISATDIRERVGRGLSISGLVPKTVERYIREKRLYCSK